MIARVGELDTKWLTGRDTWFVRVDEPPNRQ
jgi:hypothetical protein